MRPEMMVPPALFLASQNGQGTTGQHIEALQWVSQNNYGGDRRLASKNLTFSQSTKEEKPWRSKSTKRK